MVGRGADPGRRHRTGRCRLVTWAAVAAAVLAVAQVPAALMDDLIGPGALRLG